MFQFRQFRVADDRCAMKVGTDGVLLGAWADAGNANRILDIGTGSGLIALMLAQRSETTATIDAVEIGAEDTQQAKENITNSPWSEKITVHHSSIQDFSSPLKYDLIVSNPPYFKNSLHSPSDKRTAARHTPTLSYEDLLTSATRLLAEQGKFAVVLPVKEGNAFITLAQFQGLYCSRQAAFFTKQDKPQERWLLEFVRQPAISKTEKITLFDGQGWSNEYKKLVLDFYLHTL